MQELAAAGLALASIILAITWIVFQFIVIAKLNGQQRTLNQIEKHAKSQADFWSGRTVKIDRASE